MDDMKEKWCETVIVVDGDWIDQVAFNLTVNFERMLGRRIPQADLARWIDCAALDGGLRPAAGGEQQTSVVFVHDADRQRLDNFVPGRYADELHQKAFSDGLGEFLLSAHAVEADVVEKPRFFCEVVGAVCSRDEVKRVVVVPDPVRTLPLLRPTLRQADGEKQLTLLTMEPADAAGLRHQILGYSLMSALGIGGEEVGRAAR